MHKRGVVGYSKKSALLEEAITHMNTGKYGRSSAALKELLALDPHNTEARRLFATLHLRLGSLVTARQAFESLANEAIGRQDYWLAESLLGEYLAAGPRCVPFLELLAHVYEQKGDEMAAVGELGKAIEILRDDPDSENPQKAAELYSKIRELAPASPVAFQLAPLFDVQTGEFLVRPSGIPATASGNEAGPECHDSAVSSAPEHPLPEVMPWEVTDELPAASESPSTTAMSVDSPDLSILPDEMHDYESVVESEAFQDPPLAPAHQDGTCDSLSSATRASSDEFGLSLSLDSSPSNGTASTLVTTEPEAQDLSSELASESHVGSEPAPANSMASPMPWEQVAAASIQISEAETPPILDPHLTLESILDSLRVQDGLTAPTVAIDESPTSTIETAEPSVLLESMEPARTDSSALLSSPMPWEQVSDAAMQIPEVEASPPESAPLEEPPSSSVTEEASSPTSPLASNPESDSAAVETPQPTSFSWNSVFDNAWKFAAGTMAPSHTAPSEQAQELLSEPQRAGWHPEQESEEHGRSSPISMVPNIAPSPPTPADSPTAELPTFVSHQSSDDIPLAQLAPAMPASFSTVVEDQKIPEAEPAPTEPPGAASSVDRTRTEPVLVENRSTSEDPPQAISSAPSTVVESPPMPHETAPPAGAPSHWNTGEVAVQVHRPTKKKKRWDKHPEEVKQTPAIPVPALEALSETLAGTIREWKSTPVEPVAPAVAEEVTPPQADSRPDWMQASDAITFNGPAASSPKMKSESDSDVALPREGAAPAHSAAASAVDVLFSPSSTVDYVSASGHPSWSKPRPRFLARLHRVRIGVSSFIGYCFSTTRSLSFLALMFTITTMVVVAVGVGALGLAWMAMEDPPSSLYQNLTITPPRVVADSKKNGYLLLLGFDAPVGQ
ncbi:MAG TPA: tetratricopeptide repeat protein, partial [Nitrospira sp.]|nr:tetratricopeptide repeat protein [Nitrospira sp.]